MDKLFKSKYGLLIFSLLCGVGYFLLIMLLISNVEYSYLLGIFFFPAVICGGALCVFKTIRGYMENENHISLKRFVMINTVMVIFSIIATTVLVLL